jgi:prophage antirepressor-like protein
MDNKLQIFNNSTLGIKVRTLLNDDGSISVNAEDTAIGFGWTEIKDNKEYVMWRRINQFIKEFDSSAQVSKDSFIPESIFYLLGMKANNETAKKFQMWLAIDVIPSIRKTGTYNSSPIGIFESLQTELLNTRKELNELKQVVYSDKRMKLSKREKQLGISAPMAEKIDLVPDETIIEIIKSVLPIGTLKVLEEGIALDRNMMLEKAEEKHIAKSILNKKLLLMEIVIPNKDNHAYKQVRQEGSSNWCYVVKKNKLGE